MYITNDVRLKLQTRKKVYTMLLLDVTVVYEFLNVQYIRTHAQQFVSLHMMCANFLFSVCRCTKDGHEETEDG